MSDNRMPTVESEGLFEGRPTKIVTCPNCGEHNVVAYSDGDGDEVCIEQSAQLMMDELADVLEADNPFEGLEPMDGAPVMVVRIVRIRYLDPDELDYPDYRPL